MVKLSRIALGALCAAATLHTASSAEEFTPETLSVKETIDPGPNVFVYQQELKGAGSIAVFSKDDLAFKGFMTAGVMGQMLISRDGKTAYGQSNYMKRLTHGTNEQVLEIYDIAKLTAVREVILPPKATQALGYVPMLQESATGKFILVQNATPATSVTIVDAAAGTVTDEIPTPGCYGVYPSATGDKFATACGDGTFMSFTLGADGKMAEKFQSEVIFDVDADPVFITAAPYDGGYLFMTYGGKALVLKDADGPMKTADTMALDEGIEGGWAPGGYELVGVNAKNNLLFVTMHPDAKEGSHKAAAHEIWAYDLAAKKLLSRSPVEHVVSIAVSPDDAPVVFGTTETGSLERFESDPAAGFALKPAGEAGLTGFPLVVTVVE